MERYQRLIERHELGDPRAADRAVLRGRAHRAHTRHGARHRLSHVDEDLGYVALEAMYAGKPVVTCLDSGGPLEFVVHDQTGFVTEPTPEALAEAIDRLADHPDALARWDGRDASASWHGPLLAAGGRRALRVSWVAA